MNKGQTPAGAAGLEPEPEPEPGAGAGAGAGTPHNADLEAQDMDYQRRSKTLAVTFDRAKKAKTTAFKALTQLRAKRIALRRTDPQE